MPNCPIDKKIPDDCPRCGFCHPVTDRERYLNAKVFWNCFYPYIGDINMLELRDKKRELENK